jgi:hypothetical protein
VLTGVFHTANNAYTFAYAPNNTQTQVKFKRIVCVDAEYRCKGLISVSDLLAYFLD